MARMKKAEVVEALRAIPDLEFDENGKYNDLWKVLKEAREAKKAASSVIHIDNKSGGFDIPKALYERATKKVGFTDEQIATYSSAAALEMDCQRIKPQSTGQPEIRKRPPPEMRVVGVPTDIKFTSEIQATRAAHVNRVTYDEMQMNDFLRRERIDLRAIQNVSVNRDFVPDGRGVLSTEIVITYLKKD